MPQPAARLNIDFILSDDQGPWALGCAGNPEIRTPNLDRLAAEGIRFENFFSASPVCSPARATLLTGRTPSQHGVHDWIAGGNSGPGAREPPRVLRGRHRHGPGHGAAPRRLRRGAPAFRRLPREERA